MYVCNDMYFNYNLIIVFNYTYIVLNYNCLIV